MPGNKPAAEVTINTDLIETLINEFVPELVGMAVEFHDAGWDNEIHRVGPDHAVRLPRRERSAQLIENEQRWLPELAETLPLPIPAPTHLGKPAFGFPWHWNVVPWLRGVPMAHAPQIPSELLREQLAGFLNALHVAAPEDAPHNEHRGVPLEGRLGSVSDSIQGIEAVLTTIDIDTDAVLDLWIELVDTPAWGADPVWLHGDLHPLNLLVRGGRLSAVIDFGDITAGDPATDLSVAWMVFDSHDERNDLRKRCTIDGRSIDIHTWNRARAWALSHAIAVLGHSADDPALRRIGTTTLRNVMG